MVTFGSFRLDLAEQRLWKGSKQLALRRKPFAILRYLVANPRRLVTHDELLEQVWGGTAVSESAVRSHLHEIRQVLGEGVIETVIGRGYRFTAELATEPLREPAAVRSEESPARTIVGRDGELGSLRAALDRAQTGHRQICFVTGDAGIGKTTLVDAFLDELDDQSVLVGRGACVEQHGTPEAYLPVIEVLGKLRLSRRGELVLSSLVKYAPTFLAQLPHLVPDSALDEVMRRARGSSEAKLVRELIEGIEALAGEETLVVVLEDLHWSDVATIDLLSLLAQRRERARLLVIATSRHAEIQTPTHPLNLVMRSLVARAGAIAIALERVDRDDIARLIAARYPGPELPPSFADVLGEITAGTPMFLVSFLEDLAARGMLVEQDGRWRLGISLDEVAAHRPDSVKQLVDIQLDRLPDGEQRLLEAASAVGTEFSTPLVAAALEQSIEDTDELCDSLVRRGLFLRRQGTDEWPDGEVHTRYALLHGLVREVCVDRAPPSRRQRWHRRIAERLDSAYAGRTNEVAQVLAMHFELGNVPERAVACYMLATERNEARFAARDALHTAERALQLIARLPASRGRDELELQILGRMSHALMRRNLRVGNPIAVVERMLALARTLQDRPRLAGALMNMTIRLTLDADHKRASEMCDEFDALLAAGPLPAPLLAFGRIGRAVTLMWQGQAGRAKELFEGLLRGVPAVDPDSAGILGPTDRATMMLSHLSLVRWIAGEPDAALADAERASERALAANDPFAVVVTQAALVRVRLLRNDPPELVRLSAERVLAVPETDAWHPAARLALQWADGREGTLDDAGVRVLVEAIKTVNELHPMGATVTTATMIDALRRSGHTAVALQLVADALAFAHEHAERIVEPELLRLRGELLAATDRDAAEAAYLEALAMAREAGAHMLALRAARSLAAHWAPTERRAEGVAEVARALAQIADGATTADVIAARELVGD